MEPHRLLAGQYFPGPLAGLANQGLAARSDASRPFAGRAEVLVRHRLFLEKRDSSSKCHFLPLLGRQPTMIAGAQL